MSRNRIGLVERAWEEGKKQNKYFGKKCYQAIWTSCYGKEVRGFTGNCTGELYLLCEECFKHEMVLLKRWKELTAPKIVPLRKKEFFT